MPADPATLAEDPVVVEAYRTLRPFSVMILPLRARGRVLGALTLCTERPYGRRYARLDLDLAADLAARAALAMDNARLYAAAATAAETLQRSLLPVLPPVPGVAAAARYLVATSNVQVGGDWYDVLPLPDGATGLAVGDVVGHDLRAAAAMGQLRGLLRSYAWEGLEPAQVLDRCDQLVQGLEVASMATVCYLRLDAPDGSGRRRLRYSNAGHPCPILREPDGRTRFLDRARSPLVGAVTGVERVDVADECAAGSLLVLYTDGVVERRGEDTDERQTRLASLVAGMPTDVDVSDACDAVLAAFARDPREDDIALLVARLDG